MKKLNLALVLAGALTGAAQAQSAIEVYGIADMGLVREVGNVAGSGATAAGNKITSGAQSGTRLGFKGKEDLGNGLSALFVLETGIAADRGGFNQGNGFARQSFVGLQGDFGTLTLGRQYTSYFLTLNQVADPFASGLAGNAQNLMLPPSGTTAITTTDRAIRMDNAIKYATPLFENFSAEIAYGFGEIAGNSDASRVITGSVGYDSKPLNVRLAYYEKNNATDTGNLKSTMLAANYDLEFAKIFAAYADNDWVGQTKTRNYLIGATVPFGAHKFIASYIRADGRGVYAANDADQWGIGYTYSLSKRTNLYAAYGYISNDGAATYTIGNNSENGSSNKAFNLGVRHVF
ncbi:MAG: porin [Oxalobacteraceae bacterium]|jgi:predicted porin|nr:porin [Oxalobacteraceae bacterium]MCE2831583.1 porin [Oxalobacteraceae bacterium]